MQQPSGFLGYLHSFRGFAILNIVFIHSVVAALLGSNDMQLDMTDPVAIFNEVLFHDSTLYFSMISGLLFTAILEKKGFKRFYTSKLKYVVLPYFFITVIVTVFKAIFDESGDGFVPVYFTTLVRDFIYGKANALYWYLPVLFFLYLVTPLLAYLMKLKNAGRILIFLIMLAPLMVSRVQMAFEYILSLQTMIYFTGSYAMGMYLGLNLDKNLEWVKKNSKALFAVAAITSIGLFYVYWENIDMVGMVSLRESLFYIQKSCMSALIILAFKQLGESQPRWLHIFAKDSFGIYFIHGFAVFGSIPLWSFILSQEAIYPLNSILGSILITAFSIAISMLLIAGFRKLFKKNSRMFIGS